MLQISDKRRKGISMRSIELSTYIKNWLVKETRRPNLISRKTLLQLLSIADNIPASDLDDNNIEDVGGAYDVKDWSQRIAITTLPQTYMKTIQTTHTLIASNRYIFGVDSYDIETDVARVVCICKRNELPFSQYDRLSITKDDIENYPATLKASIVTTVGLYLANYIFLSSTVGNKILYSNRVFSIGKIEKALAKLLLNKEIEVQQGKQYIDNVYFMTSMTELFTSSFTPKSIVPNKQLLAHRDQLYKENADRLDDPSVLASIEDKLIKMDKDNLKDDPSMSFFGSESKTFTVHRKRQYTAVGLVETFEKTKGNYDFIPTSLCEGWQPDSLVPIFNEIRKGSFSRGIETTESGLRTKQMTRMFQDTKVTGKDCHTKEHLTIFITKDNIADIYGAYTPSSNGTYVPILESNKEQFLNKLVAIRSPMVCKQPDGLCEICSGHSLKQLAYDKPGTMTIDLGAVFLTLSMKAMHGIKVNTYHITELSPFVI